MSEDHTGDSSIQAYVWWCGDEWCDCHQPVIERVTPHQRVSGAVNRERLWEGTWYSEPSAGERAEQEWELADAMARQLWKQDDS